MFDEISTVPSLQCVLTDLYVKSIGESVKQLAQGKIQS